MITPIINNITTFVIMEEVEKKNLPWSDIYDQTSAWAKSNEKNTCIAIFSQEGHSGVGAYCHGSPIDYVQMLEAVFEKNPALLIAARKAMYIIGSNNEDEES